MPVRNDTHQLGLKNQKEDNTSSIRRHYGKRMFTDNPYPRKEWVSLAISYKGGTKPTFSVPELENTKNLKLCIFVSLIKHVTNVTIYYWIKI